MLTEVGWRAREALRRSGGVASVVAVRPRAVYLEAGGELLWLAGLGAPLHGRAMLVPALPSPPSRLRVDADAARLWCPARPRATRRAVERAATALREGIAALGDPAGFGTLLAGRAPAFPLDGAVAGARALALACAAHDAGAARRAAVALVGVGPGLTPAGDDFVGAAFFAQVMLSGPAKSGAWVRAGAEVLAEARETTHPVSAALLGDLLAGEGPAPLHDVLAALAVSDVAAALRAARQLVAIGYSSGWDFLAGFLSGILGARALSGISGAGVLSSRDRAPSSAGVPEGRRPPAAEVR